MAETSIWTGWTGMGLLAFLLVVGVALLAVSLFAGSR